MAVDLKQISDRLDRMTNEYTEVKASIEKMASTPRGGPGARDMFGFDQNWQSRDWGRHAGVQPYGLHDLEALNVGGTKRLSGMGPAFVKMAALGGSGGPVHGAREIARQYGMPSDYNIDKLEAQYGATTITKANEHGVPRWDARTRKVLLNERRKTALAENSGQQGGYTLPPQFMSELLTIAAEDGFMEQRCKQIPMNSRNVDWPLLDLTTVQAAGTTPYYGGMYFYWQSEAATYAETEPAFRQATWTAWDLVGVLVASNQLLQDNGIGLDALLTQLIGGAITWYKEYAFLQGLGAGASMPLGILNSPAAISQTRSVPGKFTYADSAAMMSHLQIRSWDSACWIVHQSVIPQLLQMTDPSGQHVMWMAHTGDPASGMGPAARKFPQYFLNGLPLFITEKLPQLGTTGDVLLCDLSRYVVGNRLDLQIDVSPHVKFPTNQMMWRVIARLDGRPWLNLYITDAAGWKISPFVILK